MTVISIETQYAGCRFRSRLEARWARFFDHMGIRWQYEPQGFIIPDRLNLTAESSWSYLPDFYLPDSNVWVEVKGAWTPRDARRFLSTAAHLSEESGDLVLLPTIPRIDSNTFPSLARFNLHADVLDEYAWVPGCFNERMRAVASPDSMECTAQDLLGHWRWRMRTDTPPAILGYIRSLEAARSARFDHGEVG